MWTKITSSRLLYVILVQIVIIQVILLGVFLNKLGLIPVSSSKAAQSEKVRASDVLAGTAKESTVQPLFSPDKQNGQAPYRSAAANRSRLKNDIVKEMFLKYSFREQKDQEQALSLEEYLSETKSFVATAYDLSFKCCGKLPSHPQYGITFSGKRAEKGRTIAVDPKVIPIGSYVQIEFPKEYSYLDGWYIAEDTGSLVKGNIIDIFFGESAPGDMEKFGRRKVSVRIIYPEDVKKLLQKDITYITINGNKSH